MDRLLRLPQVLQTVGYGRSTLFALVRSGRFPQPLRLAGGGAIAWRESEVQKWIDGLPTAEASPSTRGGREVAAQKKPRAALSAKR